MSGVPRPPRHVIVIFGGNGDLSRRKLLPSLYHLYAEGLMPEDFRIIGNSRSEFSDAEFDEFARQSIQEFARCEVSERQWGEFARRLTYVSHAFRPGSTDPLAAEVRSALSELGEEARVLFYLAVPPDAFPVITLGLKEAGLAEGARIVYEKPFGSDLRSFHELSATVSEVFDEEQVYRIDHFLGKEAVQNILALRFANGMFEPVWNRLHIDHVQIDVPETIGIGTRAGFYEGTGALRDMVVTHLFQMLSYVAMEPPYSFEAEPLADEMAKVFESMSPLHPSDVVRGQYASYRRENGVAPDSQTETFVAARVTVDNWRWAGVPFFLRTGKAMADDYQSITLAFRRPPRTMFEGYPRDWFGYDHLTFRVDPHPGVNLTFLAKAPGPRMSLAPGQLDFTYEETFGSELIGAYERLLLDALLGDRTLYTRGDGIERAWEIVEPVLRDPPPVHIYPDGSWGPEEADRLIAPRRWHVTRTGRR